MREKSSRREEIIAAAFALTGEFSAWTLAEAAERVGVSKPALYRHFKNKEDIEDAMERAFLESLIQAIDRAEGTPRVLRESLRAFFRDNPGFLEFFVSRVFSCGDFEERTYRYLLERSVGVAAFHRHAAGLDDAARDRLSAEVLKSAVSVILASVREPGIEPLQRELLEALEIGFPRLRVPGPERMAALDAAAALAPEEVARENRLFSAIAASVREHGFAGTTTERIAEKMGVSKSSLYFYYPTKETMFEELIRAEHETMLALWSSRIRLGESLAEQLYALMMVQTNYLLLRPDVMPVFNWIRFETVRGNHRPNPPERDEMPPLEGFLIRDLFDEDAEKSRERAFSLIKWASIMAISVVLNGVKNADRPERIRNNARLVYRSMLLGDKALNE